MPYGIFSRYILRQRGNGTIAKGYECKESFCGDTHGGATCGGAASEGGGFTRVLVFKGGRYEVLFRQDTGRRYK